MSEELKRGIIRAIPVGERKERTPEEEERINRESEEFFKEIGVLKPDERIEDFLYDPSKGLTGK